MACPRVDCGGVDKLIVAQLSRGVPRSQCRGSVEACSGVDGGYRRAEEFPGDDVAGVDNLL